jgi:hypothetical protein
MNSTTSCTLQEQTPFLTLLAFILYRQRHQTEILAQHPGLPNPEVSKIAGELWKAEPESVKNEWKHLAEVWCQILL